MTAPQKITGRPRRLRSPRQLQHLPTVVGRGKWESRATLWRYKQKQRRKRQIAAASRRRNAR